MNFIAIICLALISACATVPFMIEEAEEAVEFETDAIEHEIELRNLEHHN